MLQPYNNITVNHTSGVAAQASENTTHNNTNPPRWAGLFALWILNPSSVLRTLKIDAKFDEFATTT